MRALKASGKKPRRIPYNLMEKAEAKLEELIKQDIIEKFLDDEHRTWFSPPIVAPMMGCVIKHHSQI